MLTTPWALGALIAVPIVLGIYFFRTRSRRRDVSSLFLWVDQRQSKQGGRRLQRVPLPLLMLLELLVLILLAVAAARPMIRIESLGRPTTIILDASYSMEAGFEPDTTKQRAIRGLHRMLDSQIGYPVQFVLAGAKPQLLAGRAKNAAEAREMIQTLWKCPAPTANLDAAVALATNVSLPGTKVLVVTDHAPSADLTEGNVLWKAFGRPVDNLAVVYASRVEREGKDRLLLETANFSRESRPLRMTLLDPVGRRVVFRDERTIEPLGVHRLRMGIPDGVGTLEVRLADDALAIDNRLTLLSPSRRPVRVRIGNLPAGLAPKVRKAVEASGIAVLVDDGPELQFDSSPPDPAAPATLWTVRIVSETDASKVKAFIGPFVLHDSSPVTTGLALEGVVWGAAEAAGLDGDVLIAAGEVPLLTELRRRDGSRTLSLQWNDTLSTLTSGPAWPILIWNLIQYRSSQTVGPAVNNLKLGAEARFLPAEGDSNIEIRSPQGEMKTVAVGRGGVDMLADETGVYRIKAPSGEYRFAVGTLSTEESNLVEATTGTYGDWFDEETLRSDFQSVAWAILLAALALLLVHQGLVSADMTPYRAAD